MSKKKKIMIAASAVLGAAIIGFTAFLIYWRTPYRFRFQADEVQSVILWRELRTHEEVLTEVKEAQCDNLLSALGAMEFHRYRGQIRCIPVREIRIVLNSGNEYRITNIGANVTDGNYIRVSCNSTLFESVVEHFAAHPDVVRPYAEK